MSHSSGGIDRIWSDAIVIAAIAHAENFEICPTFYLKTRKPTAAMGQ